jgi:hypothetical protein
MDFRASVAARQISDRSEWSVNAAGALMLSIPHCLPSAPEKLTLSGGVCRVDFGTNGSFPVPVPDIVAPFLDRAATVLLVTFRRTNIVYETDVFVDRGGPETGE